MSEEDITGAGWELGDESTSSAGLGESITKTTQTIIVDTTGTVTIKAEIEYGDNKTIQATKDIAVVVRVTYTLPSGDDVDPESQDETILQQMDGMYKLVIHENDKVKKEYSVVIDWAKVE